MIAKTKLYVQLASVRDASRVKSFSRNALLAEMAKPSDNCFFEVPSLNEAVKLSQKFIDEYDLTSSNWTGGKVVDEDYNFIATISYNGRVWDNDDWKLAKEIEL